MSRRNKRRSDRGQTLLFERSTHPTPTSAAWNAFGKALTAAIGALHEDEYLIILRKRTNYFVQFFAQGAFGMRIEAVSNSYQPMPARLSEGAILNLERLGWNAPTYVQSPEITERAEGSSNFYLDVAAPVPVREISDLAIDTLRGVYGVRHPGELEYDASSMDDVSIRFPDLRIRHKLPSRTDKRISHLAEPPAQHVLQIVMPQSPVVC